MTTERDALIWDSDVIDHPTHGNVCEGCADCAFPGIRWPSSPDGIADLSYVERCDSCERYESDEAATKHIAAERGVRWGYANREADPKTEDDIRWEPAPKDGLDYTGWSCFIAAPERDGVITDNEPSEEPTT